MRATNNKMQSVSSYFTKLKRDIFKDIKFYSVSTIQEVFELIYDV